MKIAFFHELPYGGARRVVEEYSRILKKVHQVDLYYVDEEKDKGLRDIFNNIFFYQFKPRVWKGKDFKTRFYKDTIELLKLYFLHKKIAQEIDSKSYDFVFVHPSKFTQAPFVLSFLKTKKVYYCQEPLRIVYDKDLKIPKSLPFVKKAYELINRAIRKQIDLANIKHSDLILANSEFSRKWIRESYDIDSHVCHLGADINQFKPLKVKKEYDILFLGQKERIEGYDLLLEAMNFFDRKPTIKIVERNEEGIGIIDQELVKEYNKAKIVVCLSRNEPFGLIPLEAMACEVPVVAVLEGGFQESILNARTGFLIKRNPKDLYLVISKLLGNEELRKQLGKSGREYVFGEWTWQKSVRRFLEVLGKI